MKLNNSIQYNKWDKLWQEKQVYSYNPEVRDNNFVIDSPPPTMSGNLHIGHIFSYTHTDIIARFFRMLGKNVFYSLGFDNNGLPTERLVEKIKGVRVREMPKDSFINLCQEVIKVEEEKFLNLFHKIGFSYDYSLTYHTISPEVQKISQMSFIDLYNKGYIYRAEQPVFWDTIDQTAIAQAEIIERQFDSYLNEIVFFTKENKKITISTSRPELLPACVALFCHPEDSRYNHLVGSTVITPLFEANVPLLADENVDPAKGTGVVMCCTFGDSQDVFWWKKYDLPLKPIINKAGRINLSCLKSTNNSAIELIENCTIKEARAKIIEKLIQQGVLIQQTPITHQVKCAERSGGQLELLSTPQWYIKTLEYKKDLLEMASKVNWYPAHMKVRIQNWIENLSWDWCISRQRPFGVPIPVWYSKKRGEEGKILIPNLDKLPINPLNEIPEGYEIDELEPDPDVMDTWATSALTPQINSKGLNNSNEFSIDLERYHQTFPADLRAQGHEIIRIWAFGTLVKSLYHADSKPWKNIAISGWCLAEDRSKMSKSKGNILEPEALIEEYGPDNIRYWTTTTKLGSDIVFSKDVLLQGKKFINKLISSSQFILLHLPKVQEILIEYTCESDMNLNLSRLLEAKIINTTTDLWILAKLNSLIEKISEFLSEFNTSNSREMIEDFLWHTYCDNYIELIKTRCYDATKQNPVGQISGIVTSWYVLTILLRALAPFMPFVTEEINQTLYHSITQLQNLTKSQNKDMERKLEKLSEFKSIHRRSNWPNITCHEQTQFALDYEEEILSIIDTVRKTKSQQQLSLKSKIEKIEIQLKKLKKLPEDLLADILSVTNACEIKFIEQDGMLNLPDFTSERLAIKITV